MSRIQTIVSSGDEPILNHDSDDTLNDCDDDFEAGVPLVKNKTRKVYEFVQVYESFEGCPKIVQLIINQYGITAIVQAKIIEYETYGLKPAQMLVQLRRVADQLPTKLQLSNFLRFHRNKSSNLSSNGTQICLQDFLDFYEKNNIIPENPDRMFVADCFAEAVMEKSFLVQIFRIFFTTKRLLSFTQYVS